MNDPYAKGVWACWGPNSASRYLQELQQHQGRIIFASADWADGWRGFVDGAIEQGQTAVRKTLELVEQARPKL
jgi:lysyl oxidase-like protein 2/3/4